MKLVENETQRAMMAGVKAKNEGGGGCGSGVISDVCSMVKKNRALPIRDVKMEF